MPETCVHHASVLCVPVTCNPCRAVTLPNIYPYEGGGIHKGEAALLAHDVAFGPERHCTHPLSSQKSGNIRTSTLCPTPPDMFEAFIPQTQHVDSRIASQPNCIRARTPRHSIHGLGVYMEAHRKGEAALLAHHVAFGPEGHGTHASFARNFERTVTIFAPHKAL